MERARRPIYSDRDSWTRWTANDQFGCNLLLVTPTYGEQQQLLLLLLHTSAPAALTAAALTAAASLLLLPLLLMPLMLLLLLQVCNFSKIRSNKYRIVTGASSATEASLGLLPQLRNIHLLSYTRAWTNGRKSTVMASAGQQQQ